MGVEVVNLFNTEGVSVVMEPRPGYFCEVAYYPPSGKVATVLRTADEEQQTLGVGSLRILA